MIWLHNAATQAVCLALTWSTSGSNPLSDYWRRNTDAQLNPFRGLYQLNTFDFAIMLPYFFVMTILAMYGIHRYALVYNYYKNRKHVAGPPPELTQWPRVTVQLPIYNERYVIERLVEAVAAVRLSARAAGYAGAGRFHRRNAGSGAQLRGALPAAWACRSATSIGTTAKDSKRVRCRKD